MANEIKTATQTTESGIPKNLKVLTVNKDEEPVSKQELQDADWHYLKNAYIAHNIITGNLDGMEITENDKRIVGITYYNEYRIIIPASELIETNGQKLTEMDQQKIISSMVGAEISYIIIALDNDSKTVVASRLKASKQNIQTFYFDKDSNDNYKIYEGSIVEARIIGINSYGIKVEIFGAETTIHKPEISWEWISDLYDVFDIGDRVMVKIIKLTGRDNTNEKFSVSASVKRVKESQQAKLIETVKHGNMYTGEVVAIRKGTYLLRLSNGVNALAHSAHCKKPVVLGDTVAYVVNKIDNKALLVVGSIIRIIRRQ